MQPKKTLYQIQADKKRISALGTLEGTPRLHSEAFKAIIPLFQPFQTMSRPQVSNCLAHKESEQTFDSYIKSSYNKVTEDRKIIYIQPLEETINQEFLDTLKLFVSAYFKGVEVYIKGKLDIEKLGAESRINQTTGKIQYNAVQVLKSLESHVPSDAYCLMTICKTDLYPRPEWDYSQFYSFYLLINVSSWTCFAS